MPNTEPESTEYINDLLFTQVKPVIFTDLMAHFKVGPSRAKKIMYDYYRDMVNVKFNCIIMTCFKDGSVKLVTDLNDSSVTENQQNITDCFIYAFNPIDEFVSFNITVNQADTLLIKNPYTLISSEPVSIDTASPTNRPKTIDTTAKQQNASATVMHPRSKTEPITKGNNMGTVTSNTKNEPVKPKKKEMGLRSTTLLAKMRKGREEKEAQRQRELNERKKEKMAKKEEQLNKANPQRKEQLKELNNLFVDDEDDDENLKNEIEKETVVKMETSSPKKRASIPINDSELEELLDTTAEESLLEINKSASDIKPKNATTEEQITQEEPEEISSFIDDDGYIVTKKQTPTAKPPPPSTNTGRKTTTNPNSTAKKRASPTPTKTNAPRKRKQGSIESFFKRK